jgi:Esterase-like activity of phytase
MILSFRIKNWLTSTLVLALALGCGCSDLRSAGPIASGKAVEKEAAENDWPIHTLKATQTWRMNLPGGRPFDASGLLFQRDGTLLSVDNRAPGLYRIQFLPESNAVDLVKLPNCFTREQLKPFAKEKVGTWDMEGIAIDPQERLYVCEEANRWILRCDPKTKSVERLPIDWSTVTNYFSTDLNASFEGIAIGNGKLYVANERSNPVLITVDLATLKVEDHFVLTPRSPTFLGILHYSDLCWFENSLWVLCRQHRVVLKVDPAKHQILAEFKYGEIESSLGYQTRLPGVGTMEGLAVDKDFIWLCTDNNGLGTFGNPKDIRPTLIKCPRPDKQK